MVIMTASSCNPIQLITKRPILAQLVLSRFFCPKSARMLFVLLDFFQIAFSELLLFEDVSGKSGTLYLDIPPFDNQTHKRQHLPGLQSKTNYGVFEKPSESLTLSQL